MSEMIEGGRTNLLRSWFGRKQSYSAKPFNVAVPRARAAADVSAPADAVDRFDEAFYLQAHPDIARAVAAEEWHSGLMHYAIDGRRTERAASPDVDTAWYGATYPAAAVDVAAGRARDLEDHYYRLGRYRGYLPYASAARPENAAATHSAFGGLWTDCGNALDVLAGRRDLGRVSAETAALLEHWITEGYVIIPNAIAAPVLDAAEADLEQAYRGEIPGLLFSVHDVGQYVGWVEDALYRPAKILDPHWYSEPLRRLVFAPSVLDFLHLIFERRVLATQSLGFWRGSQQTAHQDSAYVNYSLPMQFAASWIALEDVAEGAGELFYYPGSQRIAEYRFQTQFKGTEEALRRGADRAAIDLQIEEHAARIALQCEGLGMLRRSFAAKRGDVLIWSADLAHGGGTISTQKTRKSVVTHYCPAEIVPTYFEHGPRQRRQHLGTAYYTSGYYD